MTPARCSPPSRSLGHSGSSTHAGALGLALTLLAAACGSNLRQAAEPSADATSPRTIEEAQDQIAEAQSRLRGTESGPATEMDAKTKEEAPSAAPHAPPPSGGSSTSTDRCESPCRAFASMKRAVETLCRMTGETDERCIRARRTLETSTSRVATCRCR